MSTTLQRLIRQLPAYFDADPAGEAVLTVYYDGLAGTVEMSNRQLLLRVSGGAGSSQTVTLAGRTVAAVAAEINTHAGYTALVHAGQGSSPADALYETQGDILSGVTLLAFTSLLWRVLAPLAWAIEATRANIAAGAAQMVIPTAGGAWVDYWGRLYGGISRNGSETDAAYAARIMREIRRIRLTRLALVQIIKEELGVTVSIRNLYEEAWIVSETNFGILQDRRHSRTTFEVRVDRTAAQLSAWFDTQLHFLIDKHRAAGTLPFYVSENRGGNAGQAEPTEIWTTLGRIRSTVALSTPLVWIVSEGRLGEQWLSIPANVGAVVTVTTRPAPTSGPPLVLGTGELGETQLGA